MLRLLIPFFFAVHNICASVSVPCWDDEGQEWLIILDDIEDNGDDSNQGSIPPRTYVRLAIALDELKDINEAVIKE